MNAKNLIKTAFKVASLPLVGAVVALVGVHANLSNYDMPSVRVVLKLSPNANILHLNGLRPFAFHGLLAARDIEIAIRDNGGEITDEILKLMRNDFERHMTSGHTGSSLDSRLSGEDIYLKMYGERVSLEEVLLENSPPTQWGNNAHEIFRDLTIESRSHDTYQVTFKSSHPAHSIANLIEVIDQTNVALTKALPVMYDRLQNAPGAITIPNEALITLKLQSQHKLKLSSINQTLDILDFETLRLIENTEYITQQIHSAKQAKLIVPMTKDLISSTIAEAIAFIKSENDMRTPLVFSSGQAYVTRRATFPKILYMTFALVGAVSGFVLFMSLTAFRRKDRVMD